MIITLGLTFRCISYLYSIIVDSTVAPEVGDGPIENQGSELVLSVNTEDPEKTAKRRARSSLTFFSLLRIYLIFMLNFCREERRARRKGSVTTEDSNRPRTSSECDSGEGSNCGSARKSLGSSMGERKYPDSSISERKCPDNSTSSNERKSEVHFYIYYYDV